MARSLDGQIFYTGFNNGVTALQHILDWSDTRRLWTIGRMFKNQGALDLVPTPPVFTFARYSRVWNGEYWLTGSEEFLEHALIPYIEREGGSVERYGIYVPFSNHSEGGGHGAEAQMRELKYTTSGHDFERIFGIGRRMLAESKCPSAIGREELMLIARQSNPEA